MNRKASSEYSSSSFKPIRTQSCGTLTIDFNYKKCFPKLSKDVLFNAARDGDNDAILDLFLRRQDLMTRDDKGNTALHIAAKNGKRNTCRMLIVLSAPEMIWTMKNEDKETAEDMAVGDDVKDDLHSLRHVSKKKHDVHILVNDLLCDRKTSWLDTEYVALCFDGGGARGFIHTQILLHIEKRLPGGSLMNYVDWIGGTSCGGIMGLMLATGSSLSFFRHSLFLKRNAIFCGNKVKYPKHNATGIEGIHKRQFGEARMGNIRKKVFVTVADSRKTPMNMILFRSYRPRIPDVLIGKYHFLDPDRILIWKAARCTSAAPYYFDSFHGYTDGGIVANNPTMALISDFAIVNKLEKYFGLTEEIKKQAGERRLGCVISLGTGVQPIEQTDGIDVNFGKLMAKRNPWKIYRNIVAAFKTAKNMLHVLIKECTSSNGQPVRYAREWCHSTDTPYFRFTPPLSIDVPLDTTNVDLLINMLWDTEVYIHGEAASDLNKLVRLLELKNIPSDCRTARSENVVMPIDEESQFISTQMML